MAEQNDHLHAMRHSMAHILATAVQHLWPQAKFGVGPVVENGFYYDIDLGGQNLSEEDFPKIEAEMHTVIQQNQPFERTEKPIDDAIAWAREKQQPYKEELLNDLKRAGTTVAKELDSEELGVSTGGESQVSNVSFYTNGDFTDLCKGPHVESTGKVGDFKLLRVSGAYWRGNEKNAQMQRIYGVAFDTEDELKKHLEMLEEAKKRDHRRLGQELDLFVFSDLVGSGLPLFTPRGTILRNELIKFSEELREKLGYERVWIPHITKKELYETSGHWAKFGDELFLVKSQETSDELVMKPMNCPHHTQIYASQARSYRDLPLRFMETTTIYRDEKSGELHGLSRVRSITQDDCHIFCSLDQVEKEASQLIDAAQTLYSTVGLELSLSLSFRDDSDAYLGDRSSWDRAQEALEQIAKDKGLNYQMAPGDAAFYGPKIDFIAHDALGRGWQLATVQLDFVQPERFNLEYTDEQGNKQHPVMIHSALLGSVERFLSVYIEHTAGRFPVWMAPEQIRIVTLNQEKVTVDFADKLLEKAKDLGLRASIDNSNESVGKKIRGAELMKVPYTVVIGPKEMDSGKVEPRIRKDLEQNEQHTALSLEEFLSTVSGEVKSRAIKTSL